jgi:short subunit dehydrogenase-like uncharacterized protein
VATGKDLDVIVFGATGITGRQVAAYLANRAEAVDATWGAAGRDAAKVERTLADVGVHRAEVITADVGDPASLRAMAARAKVVLNLVGPYTRFGRPVIEACVAEGAAYLDLTGEIPFARDIVDDFDAPARDAGVKIVQISGFEALPPDLAVLLAVETASERFGEALAEADLVVTTKPPPGMPRPSDMISGGTFQSLAAAAGDPNAERVTDPAALIPDAERAERVRTVSPIRVRPRRGKDGAVIAPMAPAAFINPAVIQRTAALLDVEPFAYREGMAIAGPGPTLPFRYAAAGALAGTQAAVAAAANARPAVRGRISKMLTRALPSSGFGPHPDRLEAWRWRMVLDARTASGRSVEVAVEARGHPGYLSTAKILGEAGLMIAAGGVTPDRFGCLTPATALGTGSIARFAEADMTIRLVG